jgi:hypothetical protein
MRPNKKASNKKEIREKLKPEIENLVCQEVRLMHFGRIRTPALLVEEITVSIKELKREVSDLTQSLAQKERISVIRKLIQEALDDEIERTIQQRGNFCLRCAHMRFYDEELSPHAAFPTGTKRARAIGCDRLQPVSKERCERFLETSYPLSVMDYMDELDLLYELRDMFKEMEEVWGD